MIPFLNAWKLTRSPLAPAVPIEGSETVQGLRTLERLRVSNLINSSTNHGSNIPAHSSRDSRRRKYQRFKGPFIEQMAIEDFNSNPKPWKQFAGIDNDTSRIYGYNIPASLDLLWERIEENLSYYIANYLRLSLLIIMLTLYLRPRAIFGVIALAVSMYINIRAFLDRQHADLHPPSSSKLNTTTSKQHQSPYNNTTTTNHTQFSTGLFAVFAWCVIAYTQCIPILLLGMFLGVISILLHASIRASPTETRHRLRFNKTPLSYSFRQVLGVEVVPPNCDSRMLFKQIQQSLVQSLNWYRVYITRWSMYYAACVWNGITKPLLGLFQGGNK